MRTLWPFDTCLVETRHFSEINKVSRQYFFFLLMCQPRLIVLIGTCSFAYERCWGNTPDDGLRFPILFLSNCEEQIRCLMHSVDLFRLLNCVSVSFRYAKLMFYLWSVIWAVFIFADCLFLWVLLFSKWSIVIGQRVKKCKYNMMWNSPWLPSPNWNAK